MATAFFDSCSEVRYLTVTCYFRKIVLIFIILYILMLLPIGANKDLLLTKKENEFDYSITLLSGSMFPHINSLARPTVRLVRASASDVGLSKGVSFFLT